MYRSMISTKGPCPIRRHSGGMGKRQLARGHSREPRANPPRRTHATRAMAIVLAAVTTPAVGGNFRDEILTGSEKHQRVSIVDLNGGMLVFRTASGVPVEVPLRQVDLLVVASNPGLQGFNEAEQCLVKGQPAQAVPHYAQALRSARGFWRKLVQARMLTAADRAGLFEQAALAFLELAERDVTLAAELLPQSLPERDGRTAERVLRKVDQALPRLTGDDAHVVVELLRYRLLRVLSRPAAKGLTRTIAVRPLPPAVNTPRTYAVRLEAIEALLEDGARGEVAAILDEIVARVPEDHLPRTLLLKGRALFALAETEEDWLRSALPAMRVAVHFPDRPEAVEALLLAGAAHEKCGLSAGAARLARECLRKDGLTPADERRAREMLARLTRPGGE